MKFNFLTTFFISTFLLLAVNGFAQIDPEAFTPGLNFEEEAKEYAKLPTLPPDFGSKADELPFSASLKEYCPIPKAQGRISSCVGWSVGYGIMTMLHAIDNEWKGDKINQEAFSGLFLYNNVRTSDCNGGTTLARAGDFLKNSGNCKNKTFIIRPVENCDTMPPTTIVREAKRYRIKDYYPVFGYSDKGSKKTYLTKKSIANKVPVAIGVKIRKNFAYVTKDKPYWDPNLGNTSSWGGHAMAVVGYDDRREAFQVLNSWGKDWGDSGFFWMKYDDFEEHCLFGYQYLLGDVTPTVEEVIVEEKTKVREVRLGGQFNFRYPDFSKSTDTNIHFDLAKPVYQSEYYYEMTKKDWEIGDRFQLVVNEMKKGHYIYVFSIDGEGANLHWPRGLSLDPPKDSTAIINESPIIPYDNVEIVVPGETRALTKRIEGNDHICILYCAAPIPDFTDRVKKVFNQTGDFKGRFKAGFGDIVIKPEHIAYEKNKMGFTVSTKTANSVVPIVLTVEGE